MQKAKKLLTIIFILMEAALFYFAVFSNLERHYFQYTSIVLAFIFSMLWIRKDNYMLQVALFFTLLADTFLTLLIPLTPAKQITGMTFFAIVQIIYAIYLYIKSQHRKVFFIIRMITTAVALVVTTLVLREKTDYLSLVSIFYYTNLIMNLIFSMFVFRKIPLFAIGLVFFILCDTVVGLNFIGSYISVGDNPFLSFLIHNSFLIWFFYIPSQTLISLQSSRE